MSMIIVNLISSRPSDSRDENQQQAQPTCDAWSGNRTQATAVGGALTTAPTLQPRKTTLNLKKLAHVI